MLAMQLALFEARHLVLRPHNDFSACAWSNTAAAKLAIDACLTKLWESGVSSMPAQLFQPQSPLSVLARASGWTESLREVAAQFERARSEPDCRCLVPPFSHGNFRMDSLGMDPTEGRFAAVSVATCSLCQLAFLHYAFEIEGFSESGRWYRAPLSPQLALPRPVEARHRLALAPFHFVGGSYFRTTGVLQARPFEPGSI